MPRRVTLFRTTHMPRAVTALAATAATLAFAPAAAQAATFTDDTAAEFSLGTLDNTVVGTPGDVRLRRTLDTQFPGSALPAGWTETLWPGGSAATVSGDVLTVNGSRVDSAVATQPGAMLEFVATFGTQPFQHIGFATDFDAEPWAMFSTGSTTDSIIARTKGAASQEKVVTGVVPGQPGRFRIVWTATDVSYYAGPAGAEPTLVETHPIAITSAMRPQVSDFNAPAPAVAVDSMSLNTHVTPGSLVSQVFDGGDKFERWQTLDNVATGATGAGLTFETRTRETPSSAWSDWQAVGAGGAIATPTGRYLQYRASFTTTVATATAVLDKVTVTSKDVDPVVTPPGGGGGNQGGGGNSGGGGTPPVVTPPTTTPSDTTRPRPRLVGSTAKVNGSRYATLKVKCPNEQSCRVTVKLRRAGKTIGTKTITVQGNSTKQLKLRLSKSAFNTLKRRGSLRVNASLAARDAAGNTGSASAQIKLKAPGR